MATVTTTDDGTVHMTESAALPEGYDVIDAAGAYLVVEGSPVPYQGEPDTVEIAVLDVSAFVTGDSFRESIVYHDFYDDPDDDPESYPESVRYPHDRDDALARARDRAAECADA